MSNDLNQCNFIGRLGKDPEVRYMPNGDAVANFSVAVGWKSKDKEGTEWVNCVAYGKLGEICGQYLKKGSQVFVGGGLKTRKWQDKEGKDRFTSEIVLDRMQMLGGKPEGSTQRQAPAPSGKPSEFDDDVPF